jgi:hypothetical protein
MDVLFFFVPVALVAAGYLQPELAARRQVTGASVPQTVASRTCCAGC